jgi:hypothetical protein
MSEWPQRPGFDPVSEPVRPTWALPADYAVPGPPPDLTATATRGPGHRLAVGVVGVLALLATGLAVTQLTGADGAESPEAAVQAFFDAVDDEDALGVLESLSPAERDLLVPSVSKLAEQLTRVEVTEEVDLQKVGGIDLKVKDLEMRTKGLHPDVAAVEVTGGTLAVAAKLADLPLGRALRGALEEEGGLDLDEPLDESVPIDLTLVTVKSGEGWHVSLLYSLAEEARADSGAPVPDFGNGIPARGADSPKAAVEAMVAAFNEADYKRMIELTPPDSMAVLHDYGPGLLAELETDEEDEEDDDGSGLRMATGPDTRLDDVELGEPEGSGTTRRLSLEGYQLTMSYDGEVSMSYVYDGSCVTSTLPNWSMSSEDGAEEPADESEETRRCVDEPSDDLFFDLGSMFPPAGPLLFGPGEADIVVVERDGAWYVDPARSIIDTLLLNIDAMSSAQAERMIEGLAIMFNPDEDAWYATMPAEMYESCPDIDPPGDDASFEERKDAGRRCEEAQFEQFEAVGEAIPDDDQIAAEEACVASSDDQDVIDACIEDVYGDGDPEYPSSPSDDCYWSSEDDAVIEACLLALGDTEAVNELHETACYGSDDEAAVEACLQGLVDKGEIGADVIVRFRCDAVYDTLPEDPSDQDYVDADDARDRCMVDAGVDPESVYGYEEDEYEAEAGGGNSAPSSTMPTPTTTG